MLSMNAEKKAAAKNNKVNIIVILKFDLNIFFLFQGPSWLNQNYT